MKRIIIFFLIIFCASSCSATENVNLLPESGLTLEECLTIALTNHPSLRKSKGAIRAAEALLKQTKAVNRVKVNLSGRTTFAGDFQYWDSRYHSGNLSLNATKILYDTGVNRLNLEIQNEAVKYALESERQTGITVAAAAKRAYYDLVLKILNLDIEHEKVANLEEHLKTARGFYEVGNSSLIDVTKAESDLASARVALLRAKNEISLSQESLKVAMGVSDYDIVNIALSTELLLPDSAGEIDELLQLAMSDRSDYRQLLHIRKQHELGLKVAARNNSPTITGSMGSDLTKHEGTPATRDYSVGVTVNVPVVDGGETEARIESAKAQLDQDDANMESLRQTMTRDVRSAALSLTNALDRVKSSEVNVRYSEDNLKLAQGRYEVGVGNMLEVSDAVSSLASSRYNLYQALYDAQVARTNLDEALGHLPPEISLERSM